MTKGATARRSESMIAPDTVLETQSMLKYIVRPIRITSSLPQTQRRRALWENLALQSIGCRLPFKQ